MTDGAPSGELDIIVVCNGCTDGTADAARRFTPPVRVIETATADKTHALNLGDEIAQSFPRIYSDADVILGLDTVRGLVRRLERGDVLAVAPIPIFDLAGCSWLVRACYEVRSLLPSAKEGIGGSGVYALSEAGRRRFCQFPAVTSDDGYVRIQFKPEERETVCSVSSTVFPPQTIRDLINTKTRAHYGSFELASCIPRTMAKPGREQQLVPSSVVSASAAVVQTCNLLCSYHDRKESSQKPSTQCHCGVGTRQYLARHCLD